MSRPFSYSDELFTVIGNILFIHIKLSGTYKEHSIIVEIPPAIYDRIMQSTISANLARQLNTNNTDSYAWQLYISNENDKHYINTLRGFMGDVIITAFIPIKDI